MRKDNLSSFANCFSQMVEGGLGQTCQNPVIYNRRKIYFLGDKRKTFCKQRVYFQDKASAQNRDAAFMFIEPFSKNSQVLNADKSPPQLQLTQQDCY